MKRRNIIIASITAAVMLAAVPLLHGAPGMRHRGPGAHGGPGGFGAGILLGHLQHLRNDLDLSDAQVDQIRGIVSAMREQNAPYREQLHSGFGSVAQALIDNPNDLSRAQALIDQQAAAERAMKANVLAAASKALNVLTAEQRTELAEIVRKRSERRAARVNNRR